MFLDIYSQKKNVRDFNIKTVKPTGENLRGMTTNHEAADSIPGTFTILNEDN